MKLANLIQKKMEPKMKITRPFNAMMLLVGSALQHVCRSATAFSGFRLAKPAALVLSCTIGLLPVTSNASSLYSGVTVVTTGTAPGANLGQMNTSHNVATDSEGRIFVGFGTS